MIVRRQMLFSRLPYSLDLHLNIDMTRQNNQIVIHNLYIPLSFGIRNFYMFCCRVSRIKIVLHPEIEYYLGIAQINMWIEIFFNSTPTHYKGSYAGYKLYTSIISYFFFKASAPSLDLILHDIKAWVMYAMAGAIICHTVHVSSSSRL